MALIKVLVKKASTKDHQQYVEIETNDLAQEVFQHIFNLGAEVAINARMAKVGAVTKLTGKELANAQADAMKIANDNLEDLKSGNLKHSRAKAKSTIPAAERAEAMRLAKAAIKDWVRANGAALGIRPSYYSEKAYTAKAKEYVENDPAYLAQAKINIEARKTPTTQINLTFDELGPQIVRSRKLHKDFPAGVLPNNKVHTTQRPTVN